MSDVSAMVSSVSTDRSLDGSSPEEILLVEGASAANLTITLSGRVEGESVAKVFSRYNPGSPFSGFQLVGCQITWDIEVEYAGGTQVIPQFVGFVSEITPDRKTNTVEIVAVDRAEVLRRPVMLPPWAVSDEHMNYGETYSQFASSNWVIDHCLRLCDVGPTDKRPTTRFEQGIPDTEKSGVLFYATGNGSYLPTIGYLDNPNADTFPTNNTPMYRSNVKKHPDAPSDAPVQQGFAGLGLPIQQRYGTPGDQGIIRYWCVDQDLIFARATHYMGFTLNTNGPGGSAFQTIGLHTALEVFIGNAQALRIQVQNGQVWVERLTFQSGMTIVASNKVNIPTGQSNVDIYVQFDNTQATGLRAQVRAGTNNSGWLTLTGANTTYTDVGADQIKGRVTIGQALNMSDVFFATRFVAGAPVNQTSFVYRQPKYAAALDSGLNKFTHMPKPQAVEAWELIKEVAAAEFGSVFWDESGIFRFWNLERLESKRATIVRTFSLDHLSELKMTENLDSVRNVFSVQVKKKRAVYAGKLFSSNDVNEFYVPGRTQRSFKLFKSDVLSPLTFLMTKHSSAPGPYAWPQWSDAVQHGYCVQYLNNGAAGWFEDNTRVGVDVRVYFSSDGYLVVNIWNGWNEAIRLAEGGNEDSRPAFRFSGTQIVDDDTTSSVVIHRDSVNSYGARNLELSGDWYQDDYGASSLITTLINRTAEPTPSTDTIEVPGDPRIQLGDTVILTDPDGFGENLLVQIYGISRTSSAEGLVDVYRVELFGQQSSEIPIEGLRKNLVANPALTTSEAGWTLFNASRANNNLTNLDRTSGITINASGYAVSPPIPVTPGTVMTGSYHARQATTGTIQINLEWRNADGDFLSQATFNRAITANTSTRVSATGTVPAGAAVCVIVASTFPSNVAASVTAFMVEESGSTGTYFDGDTLGAYWNGAPGVSTSTLPI
jgi:hypothetical protein